MKWLYKWILNRYHSNLERDALVVPTAVKESRDTFEGMRQNTMNFSIYKANGGFIFESRHWDEKTDRNYQNLHIINSDEDFGSAIAKIITIEMLKR